MVAVYYLTDMINLIFTPLIWNTHNESQIFYYSVFGLCLKNDSYPNSLVTERNLNSFKMEPGESNPADEGQNSNENDSPTEKIKSKPRIYIFNLQN